MYIDNIPLSEYGGMLVDFHTGILPITNTTSIVKNNSFPRLLRSEVGKKDLSVKLDVRGDDYDDAARKLNQLTAVLNKETELFMPDGFYYHCVLTSVSTPTWDNPFTISVEYIFAAQQHGPAETYTGALDGACLYYGGTASADCVLQFLAPSDIDSITVQGVTIKNLSAGSTIIIDGMQKRILQDGANKFADTDLISFPRLDPGENRISMSQNVLLTIRYYPVYL